MKGPNPFAFMEENPEGISGRRYESGIFNSFANAAAAKQPQVLVVVGGPGSGKTFLLRHFRHEAEKKGMLTPYVRAEKGEGVASAVGRLYQETMLMQGARGAAHPETFDALAQALERVGAKHFGTIMFIDDADNLRKAGEAVSSLIKLAAALQGKKAVAFVLGSTLEWKAEGAAVLRLKPFDEHEAKEFIDRGLGNGPKMGEECLHSIMADSGGNPRLVKAVCRQIYDRLKDTEKVITKGHYLAYLPYMMSMLSGEWFGGMYQETPAAERAILAVMAGTPEGMHVSDIARTLGRPLGQTTALMKRLLDSGQVVRLDRGKYRIFAGLYARYVAQRSGIENGKVKRKK
ncbi:MAG: AAA family ATPase [Candidatus ainarchaeum sp.]|nr:AAA family ATPase [Candidatus ainarchaeum sp.]